MSEEEEANEIVRRLATTPPKYIQDDFTIEMFIYPVIRTKNKWKIMGKNKKPTKSLDD